MRYYLLPPFKYACPPPCVVTPTPAMAAERTRWMASFHVAWAMFLVLPCRVFSLSDHCSVSKVQPCDATHEYVFQSGPQFQKNLKCLFAFSTDNGCNMVITVRDVKMAPPDEKGECVADLLQVYDMKDGMLEPGNTYCGTGAAKNGTESNEMSSNVGLVVFSSNEQETPRSFRIMVATRRVEAPGSEGTPGTGEPETEGPGAPGGSGNSTKPPSGIPGGPPGGGVGGNGTGTGPPGGGVGGNGTGTGPPGGVVGGNGTGTGPPGGGVGDNGSETGPPGGGVGGNGTGTGPPGGGVGGNGSETGPPGGGVGGNGTETGPPGGGVRSNGTLPSKAPKG